MLTAVRSIETPIGTDRYGRRVQLDWVAEAHHVIAGATRSGKSQLMYGMLGQLAGYSAVRVVGIDPSRVLLAPFTRRGVSEPLIALGGDVEGYWRVLESLLAEMERRLGMLDSLRVDKFDAFSSTFPLMVVVLEEFPGAVEAVADRDLGHSKRDEKIGPRFQGAIRRLVRESAKIGFRVVILAQRADADIIGGNVRANLSVRICFRIDDSAGIRMMYESIDPDEMRLVEDFAPGRGFIRTARLPRAMFKSFFVGDYGVYRRHVESLDPRYLGDLRLDQVQREVIAETFPEVGDPG